MTYDLAVWADVPPFAGLSPDAAYDVVSELLEDDEAFAEPSADVINDLVSSLLARWPALGGPGDQNSPWAMGPEIGDAFGSCIYITMTYRGAKYAAPTIAMEARSHGLVCYDPQYEEAI